jgi:hypothetical protein
MVAISGGRKDESLYIKEEHYLKINECLPGIIAEMTVNMTNAEKDGEPTEEGVYGPQKWLV